MESLSLFTCRAHNDTSLLLIVFSLTPNTELVAFTATTSGSSPIVHLYQTIVNRMQRISMATETVPDDLRDGNSIRATVTIKRLQLYLNGQHPCSFY